MKKRDAVCKMRFTKDKNGEEVLLKDDKFQVMMEWEKPYMQACIDALKPAGDVLEVGFGCGYSATHIQTYQPKSHTIIEYHPVVAEKARAWAKNYANVTIIEDTWQNVLATLGMFDEIFFDDYPLESEVEMEQMQKEQDQASAIIKMGQKKLEEIHKILPQLQTLKYSDEDIEFFFAELESKENIEPRFVLRFFFDLEEKKNITKEQLQKTLEKLKREKEVSSEMIQEFFKERSNVSVSSFNFERRGDRLFEFLERCLKVHMRIGSRFSCYLNGPASKYEDEVFFQKIILNPLLDYTETRMPIKVSSACDYYQGQEAIVMTITKLGEM